MESFATALKHFVIFVYQVTIMVLHSFELLVRLYFIVEEVTGLAVFIIIEE